MSSVKDAKKLSIDHFMVEGISVRPSIDTVWFNHYKVDFIRKPKEFRLLPNNMCPHIIQRVIENSKTYVVCQKLVGETGC